MFLGLLPALFFSVIAAASGDPRLDPTSFHSLITSTSPNVMNSTVSSECMAALRKNPTVDSSGLRPYLVAVKNVPYQSTSDGLFFHYTDAKPAVTEVRSGHPEAIFAYLTRAESHDPFLYLASDDVSSREYGDSQIRVFVSPETKVFFPMDPVEREKRMVKRDPLSSEMESFNARHADLVKQALVNQMISQAPELMPCADQLFHATAHLPVLLALALEQEHVPLVSYYNTAIGWFQLIGAWGADSMDVGSHLPPLTKEILEKRRDLQRWR